VKIGPVTATVTALGGCTPIQGTTLDAKSCTTITVTVPLP
jgi:hypothetical protein